MGCFLYVHLCMLEEGNIQETANVISAGTGYYYSAGIGLSRL